MSATGTTPELKPGRAVARVPSIAAHALCKRFGRHVALDALDLEVQQGEVFGFIGPNGAGKSTTIRLLLDLIRPTSGSVRVLGLDPRQEGVALRRRIGYLPGELHLYDDLTAARVLAYVEALRGARAIDLDGLVERLEIDLHRPIRTLSKGNKQKVGLALAFMNRPELLLLDEPTSGLDPVVQREVHRLIEEARTRGQTVFLSSHVLSEVERVADRVGLIRAGRLALVDDLGGLKARTTRQVELHFAEVPPPKAFAHLAGVGNAHFVGDRASFTLTGPVDALLKAAAHYEVLTVVSHEPDLEDLFLALVDHDAAR